MSGRGTVAVIGGAMAGLAAAEKFLDVGFTVDLYERQSYADKRVNCGESMTATSAIPLEPTEELGLPNSMSTMEVEVYDGVDSDRRCRGDGEFVASDTFVTDRSVVERSWAERLSQRGVEIIENDAVSKTEFYEFTTGYDVVVDATGQPSLSSKAFGSTDEYAGHLVALTANVEGDFSKLYPNGRIVLENYTGYSWAFSKSPARANVGIGWSDADRPDDYMDAFEAACERNGWPAPDRDRTTIAIIPAGPSLDPARTYLPERSVVRVGDAAGIANQLTGKGISQAVRSSYFAADLAADGRLHEYPEQLYRTMKVEYLFATVVQYFLEIRRPGILGEAVRAVFGMDIEDMDRSPWTVVARPARHPLLVGRLFLRPGTIKRLYMAATDQWEVARDLPDASQPSCSEVPTP